jgi:hypothetical protein
LAREQSRGKLAAKAPDHTKWHRGTAIGRGFQMSCEHLICAHCAGPVIEGRCPVCRAARAEHHHHGSSGLSPQVLIAAALVLLLALLIATHVIA